VARGVQERPAMRRDWLPWLLAALGVLALIGLLRLVAQ
jgi:hypothetical protein